MTRYNEILTNLQGLHHSDSTTDSTSSAPMSSSPATLSADAAVRAYDTELAALKRSSSAATIAGDTTIDGDTTIAASTPTPTDIFPNIIPNISHYIPTHTTHPFPRPRTKTHTTYILKTPSPNPTLSLPPSHPFRTTQKGYPLFPRRPASPSPRVKAFTTHWTAVYTTLYRDAGTRAEGMFALRAACAERWLVTYGGWEALVVRLVERGVRDAGRGWEEVRGGVGVVECREAPGVPGGVGEEEGEEEKEEEEGRGWWEGVAYGG